MWNGHIGIFTANDAKKAIHNQFCNPASNAVVINVGISVVPAMKNIARIAKSISTEPNSVYRKNLKVA